MTYSWLELFILATLSVCASSVTLLFASHFHSTSAIAGAGVLFILSIYPLKRNGYTFALQEKRIPLLLGGLLLIALLLRLHPSLYVIGEQDPGHYTMNSSYIDTHGSPFIKDAIREELKNWNLAPYYDITNQVRHSMTPEFFEYWHKPGIYATNLKNSEYVLNFYQLKPAWMAIFAKVFGSENRKYETVFFGLISLLFLSLLAYEFTGHSKPALYLTAGLLAVSPWHVYFSCYPLTDLVASAYTAAALYYLVLYYKKSYSALPLILSAGLFGAFFFTRISGFIWIPLFYFLLLNVLAFCKDEKIKRQTTHYTATVIVLFGLSVAYGLIFSYPYTASIHTFYFKMIFGESWKMPLIGSCCALTLLLFFPAFYRRISTFLFSKPVFAFLFFLVIGGCLYQAYQLIGGNTKFIDSHRWLSSIQGLEALKYSTLYVTGSVLSPFLLLTLFLAVIYFSRKQDPLTIAALALLSWAWLYAGYLQEFTAVLYYGLRYQVSELLPFSVVLIVAYLVRKRALALVVIPLALLHSAYFTTFQLQGSEAEGMDASLKQVTERISEKDLLLMHPMSMGFPEIMSPILYYYQKKAMFIQDFTDMEVLLKDFLFSQKGRVFLLTRHGEEEGLPTQYLNKIAPIPIRFSRLRPGISIPREYDRILGLCHLYEVDKEKLKEQVFPKSPHHKVIALSTWDLWTEPSPQEYEISYQGKKLRYLYSEDPFTNPYLHYFEAPEDADLNQVKSIWKGVRQDPKIRHLALVDKVIKVFPGRHGVNFSKDRTAMEFFPQPTHGFEYLVLSTYVPVPDLKVITEGMELVFKKQQGKDLYFKLPKTVSVLQSLQVQSATKGVEVKGVSLR